MGEMSRKYINFAVEKKIQETIMSDILDGFYESQLREWQLAHNSHEALSRVWSRD